MSKTKFVNVDEFGTLTASSSSDALLQKVIADLAEYKRTNDLEVKALKNTIEELRAALNNRVVYGQTVRLFLEHGGVHIWGGSQYRMSWGDSPKYGGDIFRIHTT